MFCLQVKSNTNQFVEWPTAKLFRHTSELSIHFIEFTISYIINYYCLLGYKGSAVV